MDDRHHHREGPADADDRPPEDARGGPAAAPAGPALPDPAAGAGRLHGATLVLRGFHDDDPLVEFLVEKLPGGEVSEFLADVAEVGDALELRGPMGRWFLWDTRTPALCLVAGTGVVPAVAITRAARHLGRTDLLHVVAVGRGHDELPYADELARYRATLAFTRQGTDHRPAGPPTAGDVKPLLAGVEVAFVCGSSRFVEFATPLLLDCGVEPTAIRVEQFGATG